MADETFDFVACLERVRRRDQAAARELVEHLYPLVIRIVRSHLPRRVAEEDLAQEIFLKMFTRLEQYKGRPASISCARRNGGRSFGGRISPKRRPRCSTPF